MLFGKTNWWSSLSSMKSLNIVLVVEEILGQKRRVVRNCKYQICQHFGFTEFVLMVLPLKSVRNCWLGNKNSLPFDLLVEVSPAVGRM